MYRTKSTTLIWRHCCLRPRVCLFKPNWQRNHNICATKHSTKAKFEQGLRTP